MSMLCRPPTSDLRAMRAFQREARTTPVVFRAGPLVCCPSWRRSCMRHGGSKWLPTCEVVELFGKHWVHDATSGAKTGHCASREAVSVASLCLLRSAADQVRAAQVPTATAAAAAAGGVESMRCCHCTAVMFAVALAWEVASDIGERFAVAWRCWLLVATRHMATGHARCPDTASWAVLIRAYRPSSHRRCRLPAVAR